MKNSNITDLVVTLTKSELQELISEVIDVKLNRLKTSQEIPTPEGALVSRLEVAKLFGVSNTTIDKWRRYNILPPVVKIASRVYFKKDQILEVIKRKQKNPDAFI